jgi:hypothetical protein
LDDDDDGGATAPTTGTSIADALKRTAASNPNNSNAEPDEGEPAPKIRAETDSTKLRSFLNNLGDD